MLAALASGHGFSRSQLTTDVRSVLGFGRTGAALDEAIAVAINAVLATGKVDAGSVRIRLRR